MPYKDEKTRKEYSRRYMAEVWYPLNRKKHIAAVTRLKQRVAAFLYSYKAQRKCADCGLSGKKYPYILDFDHKIGFKKKFDVASFSRHVLSMDSLKEEISKCDLVCANCHRIRTWKNKSHG